MRKDAVTAELWERVVVRDAHTIWEAGPQTMAFNTWLRTVSVICMARFLDPDGSGTCPTDRFNGRQTVDHVKDEPMMGKRAPSDERHLVALCQYHNAIRPPSRILRQKERQYLRRMYVAVLP